MYINRTPTSIKVNKHHFHTNYVHLINMINNRRTRKYNLKIMIEITFMI